MNGTKSVSTAATIRREAGFIVPIIGRIVRSDVLGFPEFPLIRAGEKITVELAERAQSMGRLFELIEASEPAQ
jgi:hypothetical protein